MELYQARVIIERDELSEKSRKLFAFRQSEQFTLLPPRDQHLLTEQQNAMELYENILTARLIRMGLE